MTETLCPECGLPWNPIAGKFPLHTSKGERCPMSDRAPDEWPLPEAKLKHSPEVMGGPAKSPRKTRSDKGTPRRPRKEGDDSHAGDTTVQPRVSSPDSPSLAKADGDDMTETPAPYKTKRKPRSDRAQYIAVYDAPVYPTQEEAERAAIGFLDTLEATDKPFVIYRVRRVATVTKGTYVTRVGRVRKAKP